MSLSRVGGKSDGGIDLMGWWWIPDLNSKEFPNPDSRNRIRVLAQCKAEKKKTSPNYVREMEGVLLPYLLERRNDSGAEKDAGLLALFLSESMFTKSTLLRAMSSPVPFLLLHLPPSGDNIGSAVWNPALGGTHGLLEGKMDLRWELPNKPEELSIGRPGLWLRGKRVESWIPEEKYQAEVS